MNSGRQIERCVGCGEPIETVWYLSNGGQWIGSTKCSRCHYAWEAHGNTEEEIVKRLKHGGDAGCMRHISDGQIVEWRPANNKKIPKKKGKVLAYVPPGMDGISLLGDLLKTITNWQCKFQRVSHNRRYIVRVYRKGKFDMDLKPWLYAPRARTIEQSED